MKDTFQNQPAINDPPNSRHVTLVLLLSGVAGFCLGIFGYSSWQSAVEPAQVISRIVQYPQENPNYLFQTRSWTILHQIGALFLYWGVSEKALSVFISGLVGMVSYQALTLWVFGLSSDYLLAMLSPFFVLFMGNVLPGINYPIMLMGATHTYGMLGLSFILLVAGLIGVGQYKLGGVLLGMAPAVHPSLGLWLSLMVVICLFCDFRYLGNALRGAIHYIFFGSLISAMSLIFHLLVIHDLPKIALDTTTLELFYAFIRYWDNHRHPFPLFSSHVFIIMTGLIMCLLWLLPFKQDLPRSSRFLLHSFIASALLGGVLSIIHWLPEKHVPAIFLTLMPARLLNFNTLSFTVLLLGLLGRYKDDCLVQFNVAVLAFIMLLRSFRFTSMPWLPPRVFILSSIFLVLSVVKQHRLVLAFMGLCLTVWGFGELLIKSANPIFFGRYSLTGLLAGSSLLVSGALVLLFSLASDLRKFKLPGKLSEWLSGVNPRILSGKQAWLRSLRTATLLMFSLITIATITKAYSQGGHRKDSLRDWTNDRLFAETSKGQGILLTCSNMRLIQLRSRRPVLLDGGSLDGLTYVIEAGTWHGMNRVLQQVYGVDLLKPPEEIRRARPGALLRETGKALWEARTPKQWEAIGSQFGTTNIMCYSDWKLQLPEIARDNEFALYRIP